MVGSTELALLARVVAAVSASFPNMNGEYIIGNPNPNAAKPFKADYDSYYPGNEWFEIYSPEIRTLYGQVFWTVMDPVPFPEDVIKRFDGKVMAITGYECDQVFKIPNGTDIHVPITAAYNHHHGATIAGKHSKLEVGPAPDPLSPRSDCGHADLNGQVLISHDTRSEEEAAAGGPASCILHESNGGEFRKGFHGYPRGYAQLVDSPNRFVLQPMQIDTWNRDQTNLTDFKDFKAGPEPRNSLASPGAAYSGLLECPCTDRITFAAAFSFRTKSAGSCSQVGNMSTVAQCALSVQRAGLPSRFIKMGASKMGANASMPPGCSVTLSEPTPTQRVATTFLNTLAAGTASCGGDGSAVPTMWAGLELAQSGTVAAWIQANATTLMLTMTGPSNVWYGLGLNASAMSDKPYAVIIDGHGNISERHLGNQLPGTLLPLELTVVSNNVHGTERTVIVTRSMAGISKFSHDGLRESGQLDVITAIGSGPDFAYHQKKTVSTLTVFALDAPACVCATEDHSPFGKGTGQMVYEPVPGEPGSPSSIEPGAPKTTLGFKKNCMHYPYGTMLLEKNPSCDFRTYTGGQSCCHHLYSLLDKDQVTPWQDQPLIYRHKWRIYYQEVTPSNPITNVIQFNWGGMATPTEYDVPKCEEGKFGCSFENGHWVHTMNGTWLVDEMSSVKNHPANATGVKFLKINGHCHAPTCLQYELWNADTNELICGQKAVYGKSNAPFDEKGYLTLPMCIFGEEADGLMPAKTIPFGTRLFSTKKCHADTGHHGEMSLWQTYGVFGFEQFFVV